MNYEHVFAQALQALHRERRYRVFADIERIAGRFPRAIYRRSIDAPAREIVVWCSNDYLGMGQHPEVIAAMCATAARVGAGSGGTRNISGTHHPIVELEKELADLHGKQAALVFTSGFVSNEAAISTIAKLLPNCLILSDELNHASMIQGVRYSGCEKVIFRHNDVDHLESLLRSERHLHQRQARRTRQALNHAGLPVIAGETHIVPIRVGEPELCKRAGDLLLDDHGIYIQPINFPTVPRGTERLRITPTPYHSERMIDDLVRAMRAVWRELSLPLGGGALGQCMTRASCLRSWCSPGIIQRSSRSEAMIGGVPVPHKFWRR